MHQGRGSGSLKKEKGVFYLVKFRRIRIRDVFRGLNQEPAFASRLNTDPVCFLLASRIRIRVKSIRIRHPTLYVHLYHFE